MDIQTNAMPVKKWHYGSREGTGHEPGSSLAYISSRYDFEKSAHRLFPPHDRLEVVTLQKK